MKYVGVEVEGYKEGKSGKTLEKTMVFDFATNLDLNVDDEVILPDIYNKDGYDFYNEGIVVEVNRDKQDYKYKEIKQYRIPHYLKTYENFVEQYTEWLEKFNNGTIQKSWKECANPKKSYLMESYNKFQKILEEELRVENEAKLLEEKEKANKKKSFFQLLLNKIMA